MVLWDAGTALHARRFAPGGRGTNEHEHEHDHDYELRAPTIANPSTLVGESKWQSP
jgi:hypothetical protein